MYAALFAVAIVSVIIFDAVSLSKSARRAWYALALVFVLAAATAIFPGVLSAVARELGVGRGTDAVLYFVVVVLIRELVLTRWRLLQLERALTKVVRREAIQSAIARTPGRAKGQP
jgi:hypothetical protein